MEHIFFSIKCHSLQTYQNLPLKENYCYVYYNFADQKTCLCPADLTVFKVMHDRFKINLTLQAFSTNQNSKY
jgi:hypothetical protein